MKEYIDTIPLNDAFSSGDECPFCWLERMTEQKTLRYVLGPGASYMEPEVRGATDRAGFCGEHLKKMYDYGNNLGNALILQTYMAGMLKELEQEIAAYAMPPKRPLLGKHRVDNEHIILWSAEKGSTCFVCDRIRYNMERYCAAFFAMLSHEEFRQKVANSKGFCLRHFALIMEQAHDKLPNSQREWFYPTVLKLMRANMLRVKEDLDHFVEMFDYRNAGTDWKTSRDAVPRAMQKLQGLHPSDPPYKEK